MTASQINPTMMALTPAQIHRLPAADQAAYLKGMSPAMQALYMQEATLAQNRQFMRQSLEKTTFCPVTGGSGATAAYSPGNVLYFDLPKVPGYAKALLITYNLTVNPASGTGATYAVNKAAPFSIFSRLEVNYNGQQVVSHPYFACGVLDQLAGFQRGKQNAVLAGTNDGTIAAQIVGSTPIAIGVNNTWQGKMLLRLNALGNDTVPGVLPANGVGNSPQLKLTCTPAFLGMDPLLNPISPTGAGSGWSVTVTGNINVDMIYLDGQTMDVAAPLQLAWQNEPTLQYSWESALTPLNGGGGNQVKTINSKMKHWYVCAVIIDGNQSTDFCLLSNLTAFALSPDQNGTQLFMGWNYANNISIYDFFDRYIRRNLGQDLDEGVLPWVVGPGRGTIDPDLRNGSQWLNMTAGGFPTATTIYQLGTTGSQVKPAGFAGAATVPRVETFLISENPAGLHVNAVA
jgi:hypothetical protein